MTKSKADTARGVAMDRIRNLKTQELDSMTFQELQDRLSMAIKEGDRKTQDFIRELLRERGKEIAYDAAAAFRMKKTTGGPQ